MNSIGERLPMPAEPGFVALHENLNPFYSQNRYPTINPLRLKDSIANAYRQIHSGCDFLRGQNLLLSVGAVDALDLCLQAFANPGDRVTLLEPSFVGFTFCAKRHNLDIQRCQLSGENRNQLNLQEVLSQDSKFVLLNTPNNPLGTSISIESIESLCMSFKGFVIVDEAYIEFANSASCLSLISKFENLIVLRTFSKAWGMPHIRCGLLAANPSVIDKVRAIQIPFMISQFTQESLFSALEDLVRVKHSWQLVKMEREWLRENLATMLPGTKIYPSEACFITVESDNAGSLNESLLEHRIQLPPVFNKNLLRISVGSHSANLVFIDTLKGIL